MQMLTQLIQDTWARQAEESSIYDQMAEMKDQVKDMEEKLNTWVVRSGVWARMIPLFLVVAAVIFTLSTAC
jgi:hypothetical protein